MGKVGVYQSACVSEDDGEGGREGNRDVQNCPTGMGRFTWKRKIFYLDKKTKRLYLILMFLVVAASVPDGREGKKSSRISNG